ncbi:2-amino-4-hydroxy-6-hydroxymethyldihydropteridine diphosphokinase [Klebsiella pneumoniae]|nr:2-amino-4-hydroxy-6-hydroxymethyldihydropteridine diphosphokinase [Klebsiella pneumoniae]
MTLVYIALGSNLASPLEQVQAAIRALGEIPHSRVVAVSSFYRTPPLGPQDQPDYLNAAVALETALPRDAARSYSAHRTAAGASAQSRTLGPRTLDLDIMLFGDAVINSERLTVPHYDMKTAALCSGRCSRSPRTFTFLTARRCAPCWIISARKSPPAGNPLSLF